MASWDEGQRWALARSRVKRDPTRYLGKLRQIPAADQRLPGDWCDIVVRDERWTLVVVDGRATSRR